MQIARINRMWPSRCTMKNRSLPVLDPKRGLYYTPELLYHLSHPLVIERNLVDMLIVEQFYYFQGFTSRLELELVNPIFTRIAHGDIPYDLDDDIVARCHQILCDEAYHALGAYNLIRQVEALEGVAYTTPHITLLDRLSEIRSQYPAAYGGLIDVLFVIYSECLITQNLQIMSNDDRLVPAVRRTIKDHSDDEIFHRASCMHLLKIIWRNSDEATRDVLLSAGPSLAEAYLTPDFPHLRRRLCAHGLDADEAEKVIEDSYATAEARKSVQTDVCKTVARIESVMNRAEAGAAA